MGFLQLKTIIFRTHVEEFKKFVDQLEDDYMLMSNDPQNWNTTVGTLYRESYKSFINVSL